MKHLPRFMRQSIGYLLTLLPPETWSKLAYHHPQFGQRLHKAAKLMHARDPQDMFDRILASHGHSHTLLHDPQIPDMPHLTRPWKISGLAFEEQMMLGDALHYLPNDILTKVDRASMAMSLEARSPLLDSRIFEYAWSLPLSAKIRQHQGKWLLRQILKEYVPEKMFERPKQGFTVPVGAYLRGDLREWAEELLQPEKLEKNGIHAGEVQMIWHRHLKNKGSHADQLWTILMYQAWSEHWL
jgi:asparagine synthase (glutamine-hydrolysing)